jgi:CRP/FNR family transcriptional regulator
MIHEPVPARHAHPPHPVCATIEGDDLCLPCGLARLAATPAGARLARRRIERGENLYHQGAPFAAIHAVRAGSFKSLVHAEDGACQVTGFHIEGDILGLDGVARQRHASAAVALEDAEVLVLPCDSAAWDAWGGALRDLLPRLLGRELVRERERLQLLMGRSAQARVATFLHDIAQRMQARGYSGREFHLRMTRQEIGSYLGLKLETVSRVFGRLQQHKVLRTEGRHVRVLDPVALAASCGTLPA